MWTTPEQELEVYRFLDGLGAHLRQARDLRNALLFTLRETREFLGATRGAIATLGPGAATAELLLSHPADSAWDPALISAFIRYEQPRLPHDLLMAPVRRRGRAWGAMVLRREHGPFEKGTGRVLVRIAALLGEALDRIDRDRVAEVRDRIDRKIMAQLRPKDLFYQILDGLRSLIRYDHSSALLIRDADDGALVLAAEQIAWTKGKSRRIGKRFPLDEDAHRAIASEIVFGFDRADDAWREWEERAPGADRAPGGARAPAGAPTPGGAPALALARLLDYNRPDGGPPGEDFREGAMIVAPLATSDGLFGVLKVAARHPGAFSTWDAELVERFRSQAAVAIQNSQRTESLQARMLQAEKKHAMADLARSVAHDVNNALGSVMPLVQQLEREASEGPLDPAVLREDLAQIQKGLSVCRRIFGGMLGFARGRAARTSHGQVRLAVEGMIAILKDGLDRRAIELVVDVPDDLPPIVGGQNDLEQVLLNLCTNARDAMPNGGRLTVLARQRGTQVELVVTDTGAGIPEENLAMVQEPFFTTKPEGSGLGLAIVRSIVWEMGGKMTIESRPNEGTRIRLQLPEAPHG